jgi:hypothetical protein
MIIIIDVELYDLGLLHRAGSRCYHLCIAYTDNKFDAEKIHSSESIMKLSKTPSRNVLIGQKQRFLCYYSELFLANGVVWSVEMYNGSKHYYDNSCKIC